MAMIEWWFVIFSGLFGFGLGALFGGIVARHGNCKESIGSIYDLPLNAKFAPLYKACPQCGRDLNKELVNSNANNRDAESVEGNPQK